ncbi:hypothetical protein VF21_05803 [Pseudogymnoascus sp. 05NY08]|nr:hypothetical protein VF21_05803 [Pseudogymnoascus sp. 05NY08]
MESALDKAVARALKLSLAGSSHALGGRTDQDDFESIWNAICVALREIHTRNASQISFEQLYRLAYKIVLQKNGDKLYERVKEFEEQWFAEEVMPKIRSLITRNHTGLTVGAGSSSTATERRISGEKFLKGLKSSWEDHILCMNMTGDVLMYMDRVYCTDNRRPSIFTTCMGLFRDHILRSKLVESDLDLSTFDILNSVLLDMIQMEREGDVIDKNLVRSCMYMLEGLYETDEDDENEKLYLTVFEPKFLNSSRAFYQKECMVLLRESDAGTWLRQTQKRLMEEADRCRTTISPLTAQKIAEVIDTEMIGSHLNEFIQLESSGVKAMIMNDRFDELALLYQNISRIDQKKAALRDALQGRVMEMGCDINNTIANTDFSENAPAAGDDDKAPKGKVPPPNPAAQQTAAAIRWVDEVLQLKDKFENMWEKCFESDLILQTALTKSFSDFINLFDRSSEYISLFVDVNLKSGIKGRTEAEVDAVLDKATTLLRYVQDKDMFERYYKKHLARRLLHGKSESAEVEKQMISRMKQEVGNYFTTKLEGMFKDMTMSEELTSNYRTHIQGLGQADRKQIDLGINVLTTNHWPMEIMGSSQARSEDGRAQQCVWPPEIKLLQESFTEFYMKKHNGRQLTWLPFIGSADIRCVFPKIPGKEGILGRERKHELTVPTLGMIVLLLFNDLEEGESLSFDEIRERSRIDMKDLQRILPALAILPKAKVLNKDPPTKTLRPTDRFSFNAAFTSKSVKIKAPTATGMNKVEGTDERKQTESKNDEMRGGVIEAAIVRIMKQRKQLEHQQLLTEVITQLSSRFRPDLNMVKKRIESLIEREYLERVEDVERPTYRYLA